MRELPQGLAELLSGRYDAERWFSSSLAPDYGFRKDAVQLRLPAEDRVPGSARGGSVVVSERDPEQAVLTWYPNRVVPTARGLVRIIEGCTAEVEGAAASSGEHFASVAYYSGFRVCREEGFHGRRSKRPRYVIETCLKDPDARTLDGEPRWVSWEPVPYARLEITNYGPAESQITDGQRPWGWGTTCDVFLVRYDSLLLGEEGEASLACLLAHAVQEHFRLGDGDLLFLNGVRSGRVAAPYRAFALADAARHGLVSVQRLAGEMSTLLRHASDRLAECDCADGCFRCLRSYSTGDLGSLARRQVALHLARAILGEIPLRPELPHLPTVLAPEGVALLVTLRQSGDRIVWTRSDPLPGSGCVDGVTKTAWRAAFLQGTEGIPPGTVLRMHCPDWVLGSLRRSKSRDNWDSEDERMWFRALRFQVRPVT